MINATNEKIISKNRLMKVYIDQVRRRFYFPDNYFQFAHL